jgi:hypothetical protein
MEVVQLAVYRQPLTLSHCDGDDARPSISLNGLSSSAMLALLHGCLPMAEMFQMLPITILNRLDLLALSNTLG